MMASMALALALLLAVAPAAAEPPADIADEDCDAPSEYVTNHAPLAQARSSVKARNKLDIVALGSSTTQGAGTTRRGADYPARLQEELSQRLPDVTVRVWNRGVGGQTASEMLQRFGTDAVGLHPDLVIWQTGVNDALAGVPIDEFTETLAYGIDILRQNGIDTILLDMQYAPVAERIPSYPDYLEALRAVAAAKQIPVFRRYDLMKYWVSSGSFAFSDILSGDGLHMVDLGYGCLAVELADALAADLR